MDRFGVLLVASYQHWLQRDSMGLSRLDRYGPHSRLPDTGGVYNRQALLTNLMLEFYLP